MMDETLNLEDAAAFLFISTNHLLELAGSGEIPHAAKIGRCWVFLKSGLIEHVKEKAEQQNKRRRTGTIGAALLVTNDAPLGPRRRGPKRRQLPELPDVAA